MTDRLSVNGELRVHGREVEIIVRPGWTDADLQAAAALAGAPVRITIEPVPPDPEPLTGGDEDINVRVRVKFDWAGGSFLGGKTGVLTQYSLDQHALVMFDDDGRHYIIPNAAIERAPAECPQCGASQVNR